MKRDMTIDSLKGFLILLVILGHVIGSLKSVGGDAIWNLIYTFHMPLFVLISGYFSKRDNLKLSTLIKPLVVFQLINVIILSILGTNISVSYLLVPYWTLWYLLSLIFWRIILKNTPEKLIVKPYAYLSISIILALLIGIFISNGRILSIQRTISFLPFFLLGYYFRIGSVKQVLWSKFLSKFLLLFICVIILLGCYPSNASILLKGAGLYNIYDLPAKIFLLLCTIVCVYSLWNLRCEIKFLAHIGKESLFYYLYHGLIIQFFLVPLIKRFNLPTDIHFSVLYFLLLLLVIYVMSKVTFFRWFVYQK